MKNKLVLDLSCKLYTDYGLPSVSCVYFRHDCVNRKQKTSYPLSFFLLLGGQAGEEEEEDRPC